MAIHNDDERKSAPNYLGTAMFLGGAYLFTHNKRGEHLREFEQYISSNVKRRFENDYKGVTYHSVDEFTERVKDNFGVTLISERKQKEIGVEQGFTEREVSQHASFTDAMNDVLNKYKEEAIEDVVDEKKLEKIKESRRKANTPPDVQHFITNDEKFKMYNRINDVINQSHHNMDPRQKEIMQSIGLFPINDDPSQKMWESSIMAKTGADSLTRTESGLMLRFPKKDSTGKVSYTYRDYPAMIRENVFVYRGVTFSVPNDGDKTNKFFAAIQRSIDNNRSFQMPRNSDLIVGDTITFAPKGGEVPHNEIIRYNSFLRQKLYGESALDSGNNPQTGNRIAMGGAPIPDGMSQSKHANQIGAHRESLRGESSSFVYGIDGIGTRQRHNQAVTFKEINVEPAARPVEYIEGVQKTLRPEDKALQIVADMQDRRYNENRLNATLIITYNGNPVADGQGYFIENDNIAGVASDNGHVIGEPGDHVKYSSSSSKGTMVGVQSLDKATEIGNRHMLDIGNNTTLRIRAAAKPKEFLQGRTETGNDLLRRLREYETSYGGDTLRDELLGSGISEKNVDEILKTYSDFKEIADYDLNTGQIILNQNQPRTKAKYKELNTLLRRAGSNFSEVLTEGVQNYYVMESGNKDHKNWSSAVKAQQAIQQGMANDNFFLKNFVVTSEGSNQIIGVMQRSPIGIMEHSTSYFSTGTQTVDKYTYFALSPAMRKQFHQASMMVEKNILIGDHAGETIRLKQMNERKWNFVSGMLSPNIEDDIQVGKTSGINTVSIETLLNDKIQVPNRKAILDTHTLVEKETRKLRLLTDTARINPSEMSLEQAIDILSKDRGYLLTDEDKALIQNFIDNPDKRFELLDSQHKEWTMALKQAGMIDETKDNYRINFMDVDSGSKYAKSTVLDVTEMARSMEITYGKTGAVLEGGFSEQLEMFHRVLRGEPGVKRDMETMFNKYVNKVFGAKHGVLSNVPTQQGILSKVSESRLFVMDYKANFKNLLDSYGIDPKIVKNFNMDVVDDYAEKLKLNEILIHSGQDKRSELQKKITQTIAYRAPYINEDSANVMQMSILSDEQMADDFINTLVSEMGGTNNAQEAAREAINKRYGIVDKMSERYTNRMNRLKESAEIIQEVMDEMGMRTQDPNEINKRIVKAVQKRGTKTSAKTVKKYLDAAQQGELRMIKDPATGELVAHFDTTRFENEINYQSKKQYDAYMKSNHLEKLRRTIVHDLAGRDKLTHVGVTENNIASLDFDGDQEKIYFIENRKMELDTIEKMMVDINDASSPDYINDPDTIIRRKEIRDKIKIIRETIINGTDSDLEKLTPELEALKKAVAEDDVISKKLKDSMLIKLDHNNKDSLKFFKQMYEAGAEAIEEEEVNKIKTQIVTNMQRNNNGTVTAVSLNASMRAKGDFVTKESNLTVLDPSTLSDRARRALAAELLLEDPNELDDVKLYTVNNLQELSDQYAVDPNKIIKKLDETNSVLMTAWNSEKQLYEQKRMSVAEIEEVKQKLYNTQSKNIEEYNKIINSPMKVTEDGKKKLQELSKKMHEDRKNLANFIKGEKINTATLINAGGTMQASLPSYYKGNVIMSNAMAAFEKDFTETMGSTNKSTFSRYVAYLTQEGLDVKRADGKQVVLDFSKDYAKSIEQMVINRDPKVRAQALDRLLENRFDAGVVEIVNYIQAETSILDSKDHVKKRKSFIDAILRNKENGKYRETIGLDELKDILTKDDTGFTALELYEKDGVKVTVGDMIKSDVLSAYDSMGEKNFSNFVDDIRKATGMIQTPDGRTVAGNVRTSFTEAVSSILRTRENDMRSVYNNTMALYSLNPTLRTGDITSAAGPVLNRSLENAGRVIKANDVLFLSNREKMLKEFNELGIISGQYGSKSFRLTNPASMIALGAIGAFALMNSNNDASRNDGSSSRRFAKNINKVYEDKLHESNYQLYEQTRDNPILL